MDIDKLTRRCFATIQTYGFSTLLDIDKLTQPVADGFDSTSFSTLLDIDKLTPQSADNISTLVLVLCWILINLHNK